MTSDPPEAVIPPLPESLRHVPQLLSAEFSGAVDVRIIETTVSATYHELAASARISSFLPILTEKVARDRLTSISGPRRRTTVSRLGR